jgi:hypothetical protein
MRWRDEKYVQNFGWKSTKEGNHVEDQGVDERILLKCILK